SAFYERLLSRPGGRNVAPELRTLMRIPLRLRRLLRRLVEWCEQRVIDTEAGKIAGWAGLPAILLVRSIFGRLVRRRLGSPRFVVIGGAKPRLRAMAFLEVMGIRALQGWGMTETTGPLAVCDLRDRFRGAFGTCGDLFPGARASVVEGELIVEGPQVASGYVEPDGRILPFGGRVATGDWGDFDGRGRLIVRGKTSDRITCENGINYFPVPMEEHLHALDLARENRFDDIVVVGDARPRLGAVFFPREAEIDPQALRAYAGELVRTHNEGKPVDERIGPFVVCEQALRDVGGLGPSGKLIRRRIEERFAGIFETVET
ncbi:MAG: AMP-binding protein, partial [Planctomycetes bacterium]|nr:AMP-binding protein [Planctomycetota bacterium]